MTPSERLARVLEFVPSACKQTAENLARDGELQPAAIVFPSDDRLGAIGIPNPPGEFNAPARDAYASAIAMVAKALKADAVLLIFEIWTLALRKPDDESHDSFVKRHTSISGHPERIEAVWVQLEHRELKAPAVWMAHIKRDADGKPTCEAFKQLSDGTGKGLTAFEGRFANLLPREPDGAQA